MISAHHPLRSCIQSGQQYPGWVKTRLNRVNMSLSDWVDLIQSSPVRFEWVGQSSSVFRTIVSIQPDFLIRFNPLMGRLDFVRGSVLPSARSPLDAVSKSRSKIGSDFGSLNSLHKRKSKQKIGLTEFTRRKIPDGITKNFSHENPQMSYWVE